MFQSICFLSFSLVFLVLLSHFCYVPLVLLSDLYIKQKLFNVRFWKFLRLVIWRQSDLRESKLGIMEPICPWRIFAETPFLKSKKPFHFSYNQSVWQLISRNWFSNPKPLHHSKPYSRRSTLGEFRFDLLKIILYGAETLTYMIFVIS